MNLKKVARRFYYKLKNFKYHAFYLFGNNSNVISNGYLFITNDFDRKGAPVLLLNIVIWFHQKGIPCCVIGSSYGPLIKDFSRYGTVIVQNNNKLKNVIQDLYSEKGYRYAICNTTVSGKYLKELKTCGYKTLTLVHEMKQAIIDLGLQNAGRDIMQYSDYIVFPSNYTYISFLHAIDSKKSDKVIIKNQGLFNIAKSSVSRAEARSKIENKLSIRLTNKKVILNVATASFRKGFDLFIDMAYRMEKKNHDYLFVWVGDNYQNILKRKQIEYNTLNFKNLILPGYVQDFDMLNYFYCSADVFCLTSREEPFGSVVLESFKAGVPVIAFDGCGGYLDVVKDGTTGLLVAPYNIDSMISAIIELANDSVKLRIMGENCYREVEKHDFNKYCEMILEQLNGDK